MKKKNANMILKVDLEKTFDRLEWYFIRESLFFFPFFHQNNHFNMSCLTTSSVSILVNGTQTRYFHPSRGIRQGDLISPYFCIICMKRLSRNIDSVVADKKWFPISINRGCPRISDMFFANDLTMFAGANRRNYTTILSILDNFNIASR
ncbi:uncharacterized protein LOC142166075 [Nicotiana tabacum]|uniref:Uncharacterized protein LOC142166075 n=1 Tax=Nicotiana tabacum TaxID=4097 RepID=A0AC58S6H4_TOBAC